MLHLRLMRLAGPVTGLLTVTVLLGVVVSGAFVAQALVLSQIFVSLFGGDPAAPLPTLIALLAVVLVARPGLVLARELSVHRTGVAVKQRLRARLLAHVARLGPFGTSRTRSGHMQSLLTDGVENLEPYFGRYIPQVVVATVTVVAVTVVMALVDPVVAVVVAGSALLVPALPRLLDRVLAERGHSHWAAYEDLNADFVDSMQGMTTLKAFNAAAARRTELSAASSRLLAATLGQLRMSLLESGLSSLSLVAGPVLALAVGVARVADGSLEPSQLFVVLLLSVEVFRPFRDLSVYWHAGYLGVSAASGIADLERVEPPVTEPAHPRELPRDAAHVRFEGVSYTYVGATEPALHDLSLTLAPGTTTAVVGASGSGKTTLIGLLLRFADPDSGRVSISGVDLRDVTPSELARHVALVSQDPMLFSGSVAECLRAAAPEASEQDLVSALTVAGALELVTPARGGLTAQVGERGGLLSGGQRQRLAIARAVLRDAPVLVLDEATSALDGRREGEVLDALDAWSASARTRLVVAHRLSTVRHADSIVVLGGGRLLEHGTHEELMAADGTYAAMLAQTTATSQSGRPSETGSPRTGSVVAAAR